VEVTALHRYPVKSLGGTPETTLEIEPWGPAGDRRWAVVDEQGATLTARTMPAMLLVRAELTPDGGVGLTAPSGRRLVVPRPEQGPRVAVAFRNLDRAFGAGDEAHRFLSTALGRPVRLVWQPSPVERAISERNGGLPGEALSLADAGPLLLTSERSLAQLGQWAGDASLAMGRFRPNVVVDGRTPFEEEGWSSVRIGPVAFRLQQACDRCVMTMIDPETLAKGKEPLRALARHRKRDGKTWFGVRARAARPGLDRDRRRGRGRPRGRLNQSVGPRSAEPRPQGVRQWITCPRP
jgi:uncharacterized protein YcbX